jgi:hypothetical protein
VVIVQAQVVCNISECIEFELLKVKVPSVFLGTVTASHMDLVSQVGKHHKTEIAMHGSALGLGLHMKCKT